MAKDLRAFANSKFARTVDLGLLRRLLDRHTGYPEQFQPSQIDLTQLDSPVHTARIREAVDKFLTGPKDVYPRGLLQDLHQIAELGTEKGHSLLLQLAKTANINLLADGEGQITEAMQEPKNLAVKVFLDHPGLFDQAADQMSMSKPATYKDIRGKSAGVEAIVSQTALKAFETDLIEQFKGEMMGDYCRIREFTDDDRLVLVVAHGTVHKITEILTNGKDDVIGFRAIGRAIIRYHAASGKIELGGVKRSLHKTMAECFARHLLIQPGFFDSPDANNLYTLAAVEHEGFGFAFNYAFDLGISRVLITEVQVEQVEIDPLTGDYESTHAMISRSRTGDALARLGRNMPFIKLGQDWRLRQMWIKVVFNDLGSSRRETSVLVKIHVPEAANFKRDRVEQRIMTMLQHNGIINDPVALRAAAAA